MPLFAREDISIYYEEHGRRASGFPLMIFPWGGLDATVDRWKQGAFAPIETFSEYRVIILDQRNAGHSSGPLNLDDPWAGYADDHLGLADHLRIDRFHVLGHCIGGPYALTLAKRAPDRIASTVLVQPIGLDESNRLRWGESRSSEWLQRFLNTHFFENCSKELLRFRRSNGSPTTAWGPNRFDGFDRKGVP